MKTSARITRMLRNALFTIIVINVLSVNSNAQETPGQETPRTNPIYFGYMVGGTLQTHHLRSSIKELDGLTVQKEGGNLGVMLATRQFRVKTYGGLHYSSALSKITVDLLEGGTAANVYFLRLKNIKSHVIEPYSILDFSLQRATYFGKISEGSFRNTDDKVFSRVTRFQGSVGLGLEYQLETNQDFIYFFAEARVGKVFAESATNQLLTNSSTRYGTAFSVGVCFGQIR